VAHGEDVNGVQLMVDDKKATPNIFSRIIGWFKSTATWIEEHLGDPAIAESIRLDLGLKPGQELPATTTGKFAQYGSGLDADKEGFNETVAELTAIIPDLKALAAALETDDFPANQVLYTLLSLAATDSVRLRVPTVFALARLAMWVDDDLESLMILDPARLLRNVRGQDLPSGEALLQRISDGGAVLLQILDMKLEPQPDPEKHGTIDVFSGWDPSPETQTPKADLVSMRATTFHIGGDSPTSGALLVSMLAVPKEHGGPGLFVSLGGSLSVARDSDTMKFRFDAGFPVPSTCSSRSATRSAASPYRAGKRTRSSNSPSRTEIRVNRHSELASRRELASTSIKPSSASQYQNRPRPLT
jgi:hypothetical protein